jgi:hypothetical protein
MNNNNKELDLINDFIDNFNPDEFSSADSFESVSVPNKKALNQARKIKARINRKNVMSDYFEQVIVTELVADVDVCITQDQIDALLASV